MAARFFCLSDKIGEVQSIEGNLSGALESCKASLSIRERVAQAIPPTRSGSAISPSPTTKLAMWKEIRVISALLGPLRTALAIIQRLATPP